MPKDSKEKAIAEAQRAQLAYERDIDAAGHGLLLSSERGPGVPLIAQSRSRRGSSGQRRKVGVLNVSNALTAIGILAEGIAMVAVGWRLGPGWREPEERTLSDPDELMAKSEYLRRKSAALSDMGTETLAAAEAIAQDKEAEATDEIAARFDRKARLLEIEYIARKVGREETRAELLNAKWEALLFLSGVMVQLSATVLLL